ncbi:MAG: 4-alpha-glucanotransferase [Desulfobulbus sp.]|jgi:4-alpha-glucanotransferase
MAPHPIQLIPQIRPVPGREKQDMVCPENTVPVNILRERSSGVLLPIFSLPGEGGIGDLGKSARFFIDFLHRARQRCWQILPVGPISPVFGHSPYMSCSAFAGNPLLIALDTLLEQGLLRDEEVHWPVFPEYHIAYPEVIAFKTAMLRTAWNRFRTWPGYGEILEAFSDRCPWSTDYSLFMAIKEEQNQSPWYEWPAGLRAGTAAALAKAKERLRESRGYYLFEQWLFFEQWQEMRAYADSRGVQLIGDLPIYVALDSADVWANQSLFQLHPQTGRPLAVAGVPPDYFSDDGQLWGNPLYCWNTPDAAIRDQLWRWWEERLRLNFQLTHILRLDHFRGFEAYWAVPADEKTARNGQWEPGPGAPFFLEMERRLHGMQIIAEDLGIITPEVEAMRTELGYPGMKILLFAFDGNPDNHYLPYNIEPESVIYTGTHDNDTAVGWYLSPEVDHAAKWRAKQFANQHDDHAGSFHQNILYLALASPANLAIVPMQDVLGFGNDCRMNRPGTLHGNWRWRCAKRFLTDSAADQLAGVSTLFGRNIARTRTQTSTDPAADAADNTPAHK